MANRKRPALWAVAGMFVVGPAISILIGLGGIASFAAYMDLHGFNAAMRVAVVGAVACVVIPTGAGVIVWRLNRIEAQKHAAQLAALRYGAHSTTPRGNR